VSLSSQSTADKLHLKFSEAFIEGCIGKESGLKLEFDGEPKLSKSIPAQMPKTKATKRFKDGV
jgi:hypothetical protein